MYCAFCCDRAIRSRLLAKTLSISQLASFSAVPYPSSLASLHHYLASFSSPFLLRPRKFIHRAVVHDGGTTFGVFPSDRVTGRRAVLCAATNHRREDDGDHHHHRSHRNSSTYGTRCETLGGPAWHRLTTRRAHGSSRIFHGASHPGGSRRFLRPQRTSSLRPTAVVAGPGPRLSSGGIAAWTMLEAHGAGTPR